ncbi:DJ-1/PfpI family protein [Burkholderiales bacterium]|nr:DJ-1/PfpI family protein [Burkholderiales bacterium]
MGNSIYKIGILVFPGVTQLDFTGPAEIMARMPNTKVSLVWKTLDPVKSQFGLKFHPDVKISENVQYDLILVPGGFDCARLMIDPDILAWLQHQSESVEYLTSVCTGSLVLAAAGLLNGYKAGCHWGWIEHLSKFGANPTRERVVIDRNRITAAGVTSGIDFGLEVVRRRYGLNLAEQIALSIEYDPSHVSGGTPETARAEIVDSVKGRITNLNKSEGYIHMIDYAARNFSLTTLKPWN